MVICQRPPSIFVYANTYQTHVPRARLEHGLQSMPRKSTNPFIEIMLGDCRLFGILR